MEVDKVVAELKEAQTNLDLGDIKAPKDGKVLKIDRYLEGKIDDINKIVKLNYTSKKIVDILIIR
ncbi:hypothetical protein [cyanobacterium endosymbiont of Rhopalodia gibberula]|uniref:hypothetical protein n=1 Tax=cyanobacterium endosymbiont of Rhopalodia gibberula TaxID=1763363 RepID=UPI000E65A629|nr:hypothetical protein [cyanobacterium endosymbiont of Rhopalodia gibberula]